MDVVLETGKIFADRYELAKLLGRGGFSEVWLAKDIVTDVNVAIKVYAPGMGLDDEGISLFTQEFSLVFDMNHTNLLHPSHYDCWQRMPYLILPFCKEGSAFKYLAEGVKITEDECWHMIHDISEGLAYLHGKNPPVIHQDIKPDNILINDEHTYMITDFGISTRVRSTIRRKQLTNASGGTLAYMGPERFSALPIPVMASDIWSLGAMMFEVMTGYPPFGDHGGALQKNGADIPLIQENYSPELKNLIYRTLSRETWERPTARQLAELTFNHIHGIVNTVTQQPVSDNKREENEPKPDAVVNQQSTSRDTMHKNKIWAGLAMAVVVILTIVVGVSQCHSELPTSPDPIASDTNYESICKNAIDKGEKYYIQGARYFALKTIFQSSFEDTLIMALKEFRFVTIKYRDSVSHKTLEEARKQERQMENVLNAAYKRLTEEAMRKKKAGATTEAKELNRRAEKIEQYITIKE